MTLKCKKIFDVKRSNNIINNATKSDAAVLVTMTNYKKNPFKRNSDRHLMNY